MRALHALARAHRVRRRRRPRRALPAGPDGAPTCTTTTPTARTAASRSTYLHPDAEEVLGDTYGLMIYQESVMRVAQKFAGYSLAEADNLRKACGKKIRELMAKEREQVRRRLRGAPATARELGNQLFDIIEPFADYAFNKSHTLRLRAHRLPDRVPQGELPGRVPRRAAHQRQGQPRQGRGLPRRVPGDGHRGARPRRQPSASRLRRRAAARATASEARSRSGCRRCATSARASSTLIVAERDANGPFVDFYDFCERVDPAVLNKRTIESLIKAGALRLARPPPQGPAAGVRADRRPAPWPAAASATRA